MPKLSAQNVLSNISYVLDRGSGTFVLIYAIWAALGMVDASTSVGEEETWPELLIELFSVAFVPFLWLAIIHCAIGTYQGRSPGLGECLTVARKAFPIGFGVVILGLFCSVILIGFFLPLGFIGLATTAMTLVLIVAERPNWKKWFSRLYDLAVPHTARLLMGSFVWALGLFIVASLFDQFISSAGASQTYLIALRNLVFFSIVLFSATGLYIELRNLEAES